MHKRIVFKGILKFTLNYNSYCNFNVNFNTPSETILLCISWQLKTFVIAGCTVKVKVKQSRYRPAVAQRVPGRYGSQIS